MFQVGTATKIYLAGGVTDMRKSFDTLAAIVKSQLALDPLSGHIFVFCNRRRDRIKVLVFDGSGLWICAKRLERGRFNWPESEMRKPYVVNQQELALLLGGIDLGGTKRRKWWRRE